MGVNLLRRNCPDQPNATRYVVLSSEKIGRYTILRVHYPDATNFEGVKILVYRDYMPVFGPMDPHFRDGTASPIARFIPTDEGMKMARQFASMMAAKDATAR